MLIVLGSVLLALGMQMTMTSPEKNLSQASLTAPNCLNCRPTPLKIVPPPPKPTVTTNESCKCHKEPLSQAPPLQQKINQQRSKLEYHVINFARTATTIQKQDSRYQKAIETLSTHQSQNLLDSLTSINEALTLLILLENETNSGYWLSNTFENSTQNAITHNNPIPTPPPLIKYNLIALLNFTTGQSTTLKILTVVIPLCIILTMYHRGPPEMTTIKFVTLRRLSYIAMQSPFLFNLYLLDRASFDAKLSQGALHNVT